MHFNGREGGPSSIGVHQRKGRRDQQSAKILRSHGRKAQRTRYAGKPNHLPPSGIRRFRTQYAPPVEYDAPSSDTASVKNGSVKNGSVKNGGDATGSVMSDGDAGADHLLLGIAGAAIAVTTWGTSSVIIKWVDVGGLAVGVYRFTVFALVMSVVAALRSAPVTARVMTLSFWGGFTLAADIAFFFTAVKLTTVANATVIGAMQPILLAVVGARLLGEKIRPIQVMLGLVAIVGVVTIVFNASGSPEWSLTGDLLALGALVSWSAYFTVTKRRSQEITNSQYTVAVAIWVALLNLPLAIVFGQLTWPSNSDWFWIILMAFVSGLLGHEAMNWSIPRIPLWLGSTMTTLIPVVSASAAWVFLDEPLSAVQIFAMAVVLAALTGIVLAQTRVAPEPVLEPVPADA